MHDVCDIWIIGLVQGLHYVKFNTPTATFIKIHSTVIVNSTAVRSRHHYVQFRENIQKKMYMYLKIWRIST